MINDEITGQIENALKEIEIICGKKFGDEENPFLVSVRSGSRVSMPGMMDTILNLGLNDKTVKGLAKLTQNERFAYDSYRRFIMMFSDVVMEIPRAKFERLLDMLKEEKGVEFDTDLDADDMKNAVALFKNLYYEEGYLLPSESQGAADGVHQGGIPLLGQQPCHLLPPHERYPRRLGHRGERAEHGVRQHGRDVRYRRRLYRDPSTGENKLYGEYLINAQGEDVVAGTRTPEHIETLKDIMPEVYDEFAQIAKTLEKHYRDMQDIRYTIERGKLYMLQTRNGKRTTAALKIAVDLK